MDNRSDIDGRALSLVEEFSQCTPETGPLPLPPDGAWFMRLCALCGRVANLEAVNNTWERAYTQLMIDTRAAGGQQADAKRLREAYTLGAMCMKKWFFDNCELKGDERQFVLSEATRLYPDYKHEAENENE